MSNQCSHTNRFCTVTTVRRAIAPYWAVVLLLLGAWGGMGAPASAQQFDNFDNSQFEDFDLDLDQDAVGELTVPSLNDQGLVEGDEAGITLDLNGGEDGVVLRSFPGAGSPITSVSQPATAVGGRLILRALDKTLGRPTDVDMAIGETVLFGRIAIHAVECRYPSDDPNSDAYGHVEIFDLNGNSLFNAWMIASSPALSALEHPRYDVWVLSCVPG